MPGYTPNHSISYPLPDDRIKDVNVAAKLADDIRSTALTTDAAVSKAWQRVPEVLLSTADLEALPTGPYRPISSTAANAMGLPSPGHGRIEVLNEDTFGMITWYPASSVRSEVWQSIRIGSTWHEWKKLSGSAPVQREMRVSQASNRRGGTYGTNGRAVLSLVFDHGTNNFLSKVVPVLERYQVPATLGLNSRMYDPSYQFHQSDNDTTWEQIEDAAIRHGITIWNHGMWHNASGPQEVIGGRDELQAALPNIPIEGWLHTGQYGGFNHGSTFASYWEHDIGAVIMNAHAYLTGDIQEPIKPLTGQLKPGFDGQWVDGGENGINIIKSMVQDAQNVAGGVMLRHHPMYLDEDGYLTSQQLDDFIAWAAAERDAGRLLILTADLMNHADAGRSYRRNLLPGDGGTGNQTRAINLSRNALAKGSVNELHTIVRLASAGSVRLSATANNGLSMTKTFSVASNTWQDLRAFFTIPMNATDDLVVAVEQVSGSGLQVHQMNVYPG